MGGFEIKKITLPAPLKVVRFLPTIPMVLPALTTRLLRTLFL